MSHLPHGIMSVMDQGNATVWAAGLGIAGTLAAGLVGPWLQARSARRQARDQEAVDVRHRLRDERRQAFAAVLDQCELVGKELAAIIEARFSLFWREDADHRELWKPANAALDSLRRTAMNVAITGPAHIAVLAHTMYEAALSQADILRMPGLSTTDRASRFKAAQSDLDQARDEFIAGAQQAMTPPE